MFQEGANVVPVICLHSTFKPCGYFCYDCNVSYIIQAVFQIWKIRWVYLHCGI